MYFCVIILIQHVHRSAGEGQKVKSHKDTKRIRLDFHSVTWVMPQWWDFGALGVPRGPKKFFFKHGHVAYQIDGDDKQNRMQVKFSS